MIQAELFDKHVAEYEKWYDDYPEVYQSEIAAIKEQLLKLPENIRGIEVGLGTGRFAQPLGIKEGIEPSEAMAQRARKRGIESIAGYAERLPYGDLQFDFVLFVTICHLNNIKEALKEAHRVLKHKGALIIGFIDKDQNIAKQYVERGNRSTFFANAHFYSVDRLSAVLNETGFSDLNYNQTLFGNLNEIKEIQVAKEGSGIGSFVVVKAIKK